MCVNNIVKSVNTQRNDIIIQKIHICKVSFLMNWSSLEGERD